MRKLFAVCLILIVTRPPLAMAGSLWQLPLNCLLPSAVCFKDEFPLGSITSGSVGEMGWAISTIGAAPTLSRVTAETDHPGGIVRMTTATTQSQGGALHLASASNYPFLALGNIGGWKLTWIGRINQTTTTRWRIGLSNDYTTVPSATGIFLRYDTATGFADTTFIFECRNGGANTTSVNSTIASDTAFHKVTIRGDGTNAYFQLDNGAVATIATNCPTGALTPVMQIITDANPGAVSADVDFFNFEMTGVVR